jgi:hypothetical protein
MSIIILQALHLSCFVRVEVHCLRGSRDVSAVIVTGTSKNFKQFRILICAPFLELPGKEKATNRLVSNVVALSMAESVELQQTRTCGRAQIELWAPGGPDLWRSDVS